MRRLNDGSKAYCEKWERESKAFRQANPLCDFCLRKGVQRRSQVTDHIVPHRGDPYLFWLKANWQALCKRCHDSTKKRMENVHSAVAVMARGDGMPNDPNHPWSGGAD